MSILIIHPKDTTTKFLKPIYAPLINKTIVTGGLNKSELRKLIETHDRVIILGHGTPNGLLAVGQFPNSGNYIVDYSMVLDLLYKSFSSSPDFNCFRKSSLNKSSFFISV